MRRLRVRSSAVFCSRPSRHWYLSRLRTACCAAARLPCQREFREIHLSLPEHSDGSRGASTMGYAAGTGRQLRRAASAVALVLFVAFLIVHLVKVHAERGLVSRTNAFAAAPAEVDVVTARAAGSEQPLTLPGETAAWYESVIYARVSGYVGTWSADIGDHVAAGQVLATIDTPELDADYQAAKATLRAAEAHVKVKEAEAQFAISTY